MNVDRFEGRRDPRGRNQPLPQRRSSPVPDGHHEERSSASARNGNDGEREERLGQRSGRRFSTSKWKPQIPPERRAAISPSDEIRWQGPPPSDVRTSSADGPMSQQRPPVSASTSYKDMSKQQASLVGKLPISEQDKPGDDSPAIRRPSGSTTSKVSSPIKSHFTTTHQDTSGPQDLKGLYGQRGPCPAPSQASSTAAGASAVVNRGLGSLNSDNGPRIPSRVSPPTGGDSVMKSASPSRKHSLTQDESNMEGVEASTSPATNGGQLHELFQTLVYTALKVIDLEKESESVQTLREDRLKDLIRILGSEESARQAANELPEITSASADGKRIRTRLDEEIRRSHLIAQDLAKLISGSFPGSSEEGRESMLDRIDLRQDNAELKQQNQMLEARLAKLESVVEKHLDSAQIPTDGTNTPQALSNQATELAKERQFPVLRREVFEKIKAEHVQHRQRLETQINGHNEELKRVEEKQTQLIHQTANFASQLQEQKQIVQELLPKVLSQSEAFTLNKLEELKKDGVNAEAEQRKAMDNLSNQVSSVIYDHKRTKTIEGDLRTIKSEHSESIGKLWGEFGVLKKIISRLQPNSPNLPNEVLQSPDSVALVNSPDMVAPSRPNSRHTAVQGAPSPASSGQMALQPMQGSSQNSNWRAGVVAASSVQREPSVRELYTRVLGLEQYVGTHEQRLNFTSFEAIWPSLTRYVMDSITQTYRYPEQVSRDLAELKAKMEFNNKAFTDVLNRVPHPQESVQMDQRFKDLAAKIADLESSLMTMKRARSEHGGDLNVERDLKRLQARQNELSDNLHAAMTEHRDEIDTKLARQSSSREHTDTTGRLTISQLSARFHALNEEFQALETNCFEEMSKINGKVANLGEVIRNTSAASTAETIFVTPSTSRQDRTAHKTRRAAANGKRNESSSDESLVARRRKRKRTSSPEHH